MAKVAISNLVIDTGVSRTIDGQAAMSLIKKMEKFPLIWNHGPVDTSIIRPVNEFERKKGQFKERTLLELVDIVRKHPTYPAIMARKKKKFNTTDRRKFAWVPMSAIFIDEDIQREIDVAHALDILKDFDPRRISVIYATKDLDEEIYRATDGQHNSVVQVILWAENYWGDLAEGEELLLPVMYVETNDRSFARDDFNWNNGKGKKPVEDFIMLRTNVFKYRLDGKRDPESKKAHEQVKAFENNNCTPVRKKDKTNRGLAGAASHIAGITERNPDILDFIAAMHNRYWTDSTLPAVEYGLYETFYKEYIVGQHIDMNDTTFLLYMDQLNAIIKSVFGTTHNLESRSEEAFDEWYRKKWGQHVKVPSTPDNIKAAVICRIYQKLGGVYPVLEDAVISITDTYDLTDFLSKEVKKRINDIK